MYRHSRYCRLITRRRSKQLPETRFNFTRKKGSGRRYRYLMHSLTIQHVASMMAAPLLSRVSPILRCLPDLVKQNAIAMTQLAYNDNIVGII